MTRITCLAGLGLIACMLVGLRAGALMLNVNGDISGMINGADPIAGHCTGTLDTSGVLGAQFTVPFTQWPPAFHPMAVRVSVCTIVNGDALRPLGEAKNMYDLTGGNFSYTCTYHYPSSIGGGAVTGTGTVTTLGNQMNYALSMTGDYHGPVDLTGISGAQILWTRGPGDSILETGNATVLRATGDVFPLAWTVSYSNGGSLLPADEIGSIQYSVMSFSSNVLNVAYTGEIKLVPEPAAMGFSLAAAVLASRRRRVGD